MSEVPKHDTIVLENNFYTVQLYPHVCLQNEAIRVQEKHLPPLQMNHVSYRKILSATCKVAIKLRNLAFQQVLTIANRYCACIWQIDYGIINSPEPKAHR